MESNKGFFLFVAQVSLPVTQRFFYTLKPRSPTFPAQDLLVATDFEKTFSSNALEPVMYISEARWVKVGQGIPYHTSEGCSNGMHKAVECVYTYILYDYICMYLYLCIIILIIKSKWSINDLLGSTVVVLRLLLVVTFYYDIHAYMCVFMISCYSTIESVLRCCCSCNIIYVHMRSTTTIILICQCHLVPWTLLILWRPEI